ncbi:MAG: PilT/PilU family type 4a pilus ATPase [Myxococcota bacterium]|jgi:twitching motility protein PilT|nr:PilT/PilU family type 4a pilus ATPase [Myxococcota bacterium]
MDHKLQGPREIDLRADDADSQPIELASGPPTSPVPVEEIRPVAIATPQARQPMAQAAAVDNRPIRIAKGGMLGATLVESGFITHEQMLAILEEQSRSSANLPFGKLAVQLGYVSAATIDRVLEAQKRFKEESIRAEADKHVPVENFSNAPPAPVTTKRPLELLWGWLDAALQHRASDLHVKSGKPLVLRHCGRLVQSNQPALPAQHCTAVLLSILDDEEKALLKEQRSIVKCLDLPSGGRARCNLFFHLGGLNGVFRLIPAEAPSLMSLNLPPAVGKFTTYRQGLVLVTGPIGSGKTNTLAALVDVVNSDRAEHIITIENPVEFVFSCKRSLVTQREVGRHTMSFSSALRAALREDPDAIVVGDLNDVETARLAISAAETGHIVFATLHTRSAVRAVSRLIDLFPPDEQAQVRSVLVESLRGVVSQHLVPRADGRGLVPVCEVLVATPAVRSLIYDQKIHQLRNAMQMSRDAGNMTMAEHTAMCVQQGIIDAATAARLATVA